MDPTQRVRNEWSSRTLVRKLPESALEETVGGEGGCREPGAPPRNKAKMAFQSSRWGRQSFHIVWTLVHIVVNLDAYFSNV